MLRRLHSLPALGAALLFIVVAITGATLSVFPALERADASDVSGLDVATLAARVGTRLAGVETLVREPSGVLVAYHAQDGTPRVSVVDPATGAAVAEYRVPAFQRWTRNLHRKLLLDDAGRVATGLAAACLLFVVIAGLLLLARRMGGWRQLLAPVRGTPLQRLHDETARVVVAGLVLSSATGLFMSLTTFGFVPEGGDAGAFPDGRPSAATPMATAHMPALQALAAARLRQLKFASPDDPDDVIEVETLDGSGTVDPATGRWLDQHTLDGWQRLQATVVMLHTGDGLWWLALLLGACALTVPLLSVTGVLLWLRRHRARPRLPANARAQDTDVVLLVGSEGNTSWGFAVALHDALARAGLRVHTTPMNDVSDRHGQARRWLVLTATYGDGEAPAGARRFLDRLSRLRPAAGTSFAVVGFGDRQFPRFCAFATQVHAALAAKGLTALGTPGTVDRQSEPDFRRWCEWLGPALGVALDVRYTPLLPRTTALELVSRSDCGADPQTRTAVLRFAPVSTPRGWRHWLLARLPAFETGDLLGVMAPGGAAPRYYSLASGSADGVVEICVRRQAGGVCSTFLTDLQPGDRIDAFVRPHESFRPQAGSAPVILVGAGTGIGPLIGFIRHNPVQRPMHLYFGARSADDGFLYRDELQQLLLERRLGSLTTAFSRASGRAYVQDRLVDDAQRLRDCIAQGAQVLVCGGRRMAEGVADAWERILAGSGLSVAQLRAQGRYVEDVY